METLDEAIAEIKRARSGVSKAEVRTELESITASIEEMQSTASGERTDADQAFGDTDFQGTAPRDDHLRELEKNLRKLAENADEDDVREHLAAAEEQIAAVRTATEDG